MLCAVLRERWGKGVSVACAWLLPEALVQRSNIAHNNCVCATSAVITAISAFSGYIHFYDSVDTYHFVSVGDLVSTCFTPFAKG